MQSTGDTAVMLRALGLHGPEAVGWLRGMFAFACWDPRQRRLLAGQGSAWASSRSTSRGRPDPMRAGRWPSPRSFARCSRPVCLGTPRLDPQAAASCVWNGFVVGSGTAVQGVELLWPGRLIEFDGEGREVRSRGLLAHVGPVARSGHGRGESGRSPRGGLRLHLASDVPLAVFLSGGVDSSAMANLAQRAAQSPIHTFTLAFEEQELNEGPIARRIAAAIGTQHHEVVLTEGHFVENLETALDSLDQPTFDGLNAYFMSQRHPLGRVHRGAVGHWRRRTVRRLHVLPRPAGAAALVPARGLGAARPAGGRWPSWRPGRCAAPAAPVPPQTRWAKLPEMVRHGDDLLALYQLAYALFLPGFQRELLAPDFAEALADGLPPAMRQRILAETGGRTPLSAISVMEQRLFLGERLLRDNDVASMASSLEQRVPLVDQVLFESVDRLPDHARYAAARPQGDAAAHRPARPRPGAVRAAEERVRPAVRPLDPPRPEGRHGRDPARSAGDRGRRARPRSGGAALARLPRRGARACTGRGSGRSTSSSAGVTATGSFR